MTLSTRGALYHGAYSEEAMTRLKYNPKDTLSRQRVLFPPEWPQNHPQDNTPIPQNFSVLRAAKETVKGIFRPISTLIHHPFKTAFTLGATIVLAAAAPITVPIMVAAGFGFGALQTAKGIRTALSEAAYGNYAASEKAFGNIGEGAFSIVSSLIGIRQAGAIAAEAKAARLSLSSTTSLKEKMAAIDNGMTAAIQIQKGSYLNAFKETFSVFSLEGVKTTGTQLNPIRLTALAKAKSQTLVSLFTESPVVDLNASLTKAQRFLGIKNQDLPKLVPNVSKEISGSNNANKGAGAHGFYNIKNHTIHVEPDRLKALTDRLPVIKNLPRPLQYFLANLYKRQYNVDEIVAHELTHAQQFKQITQLSKTEATQLLQHKFPDLKPQYLNLATEAIPFQGNTTKVLSSKRQQLAEQGLLSHVESIAHKIKHSQLKIEAREQGAIVRLFQHLQKEKSAYYWDGLEIQARQKAAEAGIVDTLQTLRQSSSVASQNEGLQRYRTLKVEAKLNKLMTQIKQAQTRDDFISKRFYKNQLQQWLTISKKQTITTQYLKQEQQMKQAMHRLQNNQTQSIQSALSAYQPIQWIRNLIQLPGRILGWAWNLFSSKQAVPQGSLKPAYISLNHVINRQTTQLKQTKRQQFF